MSMQYLNRVQFAAELEKCLKCPSKPCEKACPVHCSPHDFIAAAKSGDMQAAAELITAQNPCGEVCGLVCPDRFCVRACLRRLVDQAVKIPEVQAEIMRQSRQSNAAQTEIISPNGKKIAVIGSGPAGIGAVRELTAQGFQVSVFEKEASSGGAVNLIPAERLPREVLRYEWNKILQSSLVEVIYNTEVNDFSYLTNQGFVAVIVAVGEQKSRSLGIAGEEFAVDYRVYLRQREKYRGCNKVAIIGGGAAAVDCVLSAVNNGAETVEMFVRRRIGDMRITPKERAALLKMGADITTMTRVAKIVKEQGKLTAYTLKTKFNSEGKLVDEEDTQIPRRGYDLIVSALGAERERQPKVAENVFYAGDYLNGSSTVVEALASGKKAAADVIRGLGF